MKAEDLIRIEHKLDLVINALQEAGLMIKELPSLVGIQKDLCSLCNYKIKLLADPVNGEVIRKCGCKLPIQAYKLDLTPITNEDTNANIRSETNEISSDQSE